MKSSPVPRVVVNESDSMNLPQSNQARKRAGYHAVWLDPITFQALSDARGVYQKAVGPSAIGRAVPAWEVVRFALLQLSQREAGAK